MGFVHTVKGITRRLLVTFLAADPEITTQGAIRHLRGVRGMVDDERLKDELRIVEMLLDHRVDTWVYEIQKLGSGTKYEIILGALDTFQRVLELGNKVNQETVIDQAFRLAEHVSEARLAIRPRFLPWMKVVLMELMKVGIYNDEFMISRVRAQEQMYVGVPRVRLIQHIQCSN